jgi:uncharacterized protein (TIGR00252 family)
MKHNRDGAQAEEAVAEYLAAQGYKVVDQNWKTKWCEIDVVAQKDGCMYFVEVKYRTGDEQGNGFDYITSSKQRQMGFAADLWVAKNRWSGDYVLSAAEVSGPDFHVEFLEQI